jgi:hypothetical protein
VIAASGPDALSAYSDYAFDALHPYGDEAQSGFFFGKAGEPAPREVLRSAPFGRITFANSDLAGAMDHRYSILEAQRAIGQLLDQVLNP